MARLGRGHPIPVTHKGGLTYHQASTDLPTFSLDWAFPAVTVVSPSVTIPLPTFSLTWSFPFITLPVALPTFALSWTFPTVSAVVPVKPGDALTGADGQLEWNGFLMGAGTLFRVQEIVGWRSLPPVSDLNVDRPSRHGAWPARKLTQQRVVTIKVRIDSGADPDDVDGLLDQLDAATGIPEAETPLPLVIKGRGDPQLAFGQITDRDIPMDGEWSVGLPGGAIQIVCPDPRRYSLLQHGVNVPLTTPTQLANTGNTGTHPLVRIHGPCTNPSVVNSTLGRTLAFTVSIADGDFLEVDTDNGTATMDGDNQMSALGAGSSPVQDWVLASGPNTITYTAATGGSNGVDILWRDATL